MFFRNSWAIFLMPVKFQALAIHYILSILPGQLDRVRQIGVLNYCFTLLVHMRLVAFLVIIISFKSFGQMAEESEIKTQLTEATVFLQGAQVTRVGSVTIPNGKTTLIIKGLSPHMDEKSIQVKATGDFTVLSVNHRFDFLNQRTQDSKIDSLQKLIESYEYQIQSSEIRMLVLTEKQSLLNANKKLGTLESGTTIDQLQQAIVFYDKELSAIKNEGLEIKIKIQDLENKKSKLEQQIADVSSQLDLPTSQIEIRVEAEKQAKGDFNISYLVANCGWYPNYDIRAKNVNSPIELKYKADVYQSTGVDWDNVKLKFSNGNPNQSGLAPVLSTWYLNYERNTIYTSDNMHLINRSVRSVSGRVYAAAGREPIPGVNIVVKGSTIGTVSDIDGNYELTLPNNAEYLTFSFIGLVTKDVPIHGSRIDVYMDNDAQQLSEVVIRGYGSMQGQARGVRVDEYAAPEKAKNIVTTKLENQTTVEFEVEQPYSIKSNGTKLSIELNKFDIDAYYQYYAVPKLDKDAFLIARILDWDQYSLLEGEANLFFEDAYVGRSILDAKSLGDTLDISLGRDRNIVIGRNKVNDYTKNRTIGSNKIESRGYKIIVRNKKSQPINLTLFDQIPVAAISEIDVEVTELSNGELNEQTGEVTWEFSLDPLQQTELNLGYQVKYPKKESVNVE